MSLKISPTGTKVGRRLSGNLGTLYDPFAINWFSTSAGRISKKLTTYLDTYGPPDDWFIFHHERRGEAGLIISVHILPRDNRIVLRYDMRVDSITYQEWIKPHKVLMEGLYTFRLGPLIFAHPGRRQNVISDTKLRIDVMEMVQGFQNSEEVTVCFNLFKESISVEVTKEPSNPTDSPVWNIIRVK